VTCGDIFHVTRMFTVVWYTSGLGGVNILPDQHKISTHTSLALISWTGCYMQCEPSASADSYVIKPPDSLFTKYGCELALLVGFSELNIYCIGRYLMENTG
jgi:hypothetical protein